MTDVMPVALPGEEWHWIAGFEGIYMVSSEPRLWSVPRATSRGGFLRQCYRLEDGYANVGLCKDGILQIRLVHQLVAEAFLGPRPKGLVIRHLDGDPANNRPSNLAYGTRSENAQDAIRHGTFYAPGWPRRPKPDRVRPSYPETPSPHPEGLPERWLPVSGYEENYLVSDQGRVWSRPRTTTHGGILKEAVDRQRRTCVNLTKNGKQKTRRVHQLVAEVFVEGWFEGAEVCHGDDDPSNNAASNLSWDTHKRNMEQMARRGRGRAKITECVNGHEYTESNTLWQGGRRSCATCKKISAERSTERRKRGEPLPKRECPWCGCMFECPSEQRARKYCKLEHRKEAQRARDRARARIRPVYPVVDHTQWLIPQGITPSAGRSSSSLWHS